MSTLPDIKKDFSGWYQEIVYQAELADQAPVRGTMVIRPYGNALWENIKSRLDQRIKETGHENAIFPLFIPESFLKREAAHIEGFAPELAVVTHAGGKKLEEPLVVRPTSETIIHAMFAKWIRSWRDLPLKINQWANVVRWEMRPRAFLRTTEFFWQEGHTAHATYQEAEEEAYKMLREYVDLCENWLAIPVVAGEKTASERFPGAEKTLTFEGIMPDGKALQMGTSHVLNQSFAKVADMKFQDKDGAIAYPYLTSWGTTTRLVGAVVMVHGDEKGLILPPKIAPFQVVIIPILIKNKDNAMTLAAAQKMAEDFKQAGIRCKVDADDTKTPGAKFFHWEMKGVPLRIEIGPRDLEANQAIVADRLGLAKEPVTLDGLTTHVSSRLEIIQQAMFKRAVESRASLWRKGEKLSEFGPKLAEENCFYQTGWCGDPACEQQLKQYKSFTRCLLEEKTFKECFVCDRPNLRDVLVAKSY
jgi:prolyl-tRNA synthetase